MGHPVRDAQAFMEQVCKAYGIDYDNVQRIVIEASYDTAIMIYVQLRGDERLLTVTWADVEAGVMYAPKDIELGH